MSTSLHRSQLPPLPLAFVSVIALCACTSMQRVHLSPNQFVPMEPNGGGSLVAVAPVAEGVPDPIGHPTLTVFAIPSGSVVLHEGPKKIMEALSEALEAADYRPVAAVDRPEGPVLVCKVDRIEFSSYTWFMPLIMIRGDVGLSLSLVDDGGLTLWQRDYTSAFDGRGTNENFDRAVNIAFGKIMTQAVADFTSAEFRAACCAMPLPDRVSAAEADRIWTIEPTPRMIVLAQILSGARRENAWFSPEDQVLATTLRFAGGSLALHDEYFDEIDDPARCSVRRTRLALDGSRARPERIELSCDEFWGKIASVDRYFEVRGGLPASAMDLRSFLDAGTVELEGRNE